MPSTPYEVIDAYKQSALNWRERRHPEWTETTMFYRDRVWYDRLTQRQTVNVPLMKYTIKTLLKEIDEAPELYFTNKSNDEQKEIFFNESYTEDARTNAMIVKDIISKKQVLLFGRTFLKLNIVNGRLVWSVCHPQDMLVDRYVDPSDINSARFISHINIFRPLSSIQMNTMYDASTIRELTKYYKDTKEGIVKAQENAQQLSERNETMAQLGVTDIQDPLLGETYVELSENFLVQYDPGQKQDEIFFSVSCPDIHSNLTGNDVPLDEVIGKAQGDYWKTHHTFESWADDPDATDFWTDGVGDTMRMPNKMLNSLFSQQIENRTMRNFGMTFYDSSLIKDGSFQPQTYPAEPFGFYPFPGDPNKMTKRVDIPDLSDSFNMVNFIMTLADKASGASSASQGQVEKTKVTLGEIQLALANAKERARGMSPLYTRSYECFGEKYAMMKQAGAANLDPMTVYKKGRRGKRVWERDIKPADYQDEAGYLIEVHDRNQNRDKTIEKVQTLQATRQVMPGNKPLDIIYKRTLLELNDLPASDIKEVLDYEKHLADQLANAPAMPGQIDPKTGQPMMTPGAVPQPAALPAVAGA